MFFLAIYLIEMLSNRDCSLRDLEKFNKRRVAQQVFRKEGPDTRKLFKKAADLLSRFRAHGVFFLPALAYVVVSNVQRKNRI